MLYYYYSIESSENPNSFMNNTIAQFGLGSNLNLYNFMSTLDWFI